MAYCSLYILNNTNIHGPQLGIKILKYSLVDLTAEEAAKVFRLSPECLVRSVMSL